METKKENMEYGKQVGFKSYYVVWKLQNETFQTKQKNKFKSYYVVWKQEFRINVSANNVKFKSYYVVWKLEFPDEFLSTNFGLNRTMQYGNHENVGKTLNISKV